MTTIVGIDLGTTNSAIGWMGDSGPQLIPNSIGKRLTPSVVGFDLDGAVLVGEAARELQVVSPDRCASVFKRHMGTGWSKSLCGKEFESTQLSSLVLRALVADAESFLGESVDDAVITVPAYFNERQRRATIFAGKMAGLNVERIINEPTAAAIAYGLPEPNNEKLVAVMDLGGGTFDISIVEFFDGVVEVRASSGDACFGGEDFTSALVNRVLEQHGIVYERAEFESPLLVSRTKQLCEDAKIRLSEVQEVNVRIADHEGKLQDDSPVCSVSATQFREWTDSLIARVEPTIRRALGDAKLTFQDMDEVILVGGATRMPALIERAAKMFAKQPRCSINPDEVVAMGAAIQAGLHDRNAALSDLVVTDVAPFTLGHEIVKKFGTEHRSGYFCPLIERNTSIPASRSHRVTTVNNNQTEIKISVYQGESRRVEENLFLGELSVEGIPPGPPGSEVDIRFTYDLNGVLEVETTVVETKQKAALVLTQHADHLDEIEIASAIEAMQSIKIHPRDESENRLLLRRAERRFEELSLTERDALGGLIDGFEEAMDIGDPGAIDKYKDQLRKLLERFEHGQANFDD